MQLLQAIRVIGLSLLAFVSALAVTPGVARLLERFGVKKQIRSADSAPVFAKLHQAKAGTPTMGGIIIWATALGLAVILWAMHSLFDGFWSYMNFIDRAQTYLPLAAMAIAAAVGLVDDWLGVLRIGHKGGGVSVKAKLVLYTVMALTGALWFYFRLNWDVIYIPFLGNFMIGAWYIPIFMFIVIASGFSANETDGLDGLLGGTSLFTFGALTVVAFVLGRYNLAAFGAVVIGSLLAFLWYNIYPARFFMGDTGSMALGVTIGVITMLTNTTVLLPFFAVIFVVESLSVIVQMTSKKLFKRKIFRSTPIHHHFEAQGWHETRVTMRFWIVSAIMSAMGLIIFFLARFL